MIYLSMATPVKGVPVQGGISIQGDFTTLPVPGQGGWIDVNLRCGKGMPLVKMPRVVWTKPATDPAVMPNLLDLHNAQGNGTIDIIIKNAQSDIDTAISTARDKMGGWFNTLIKPGWDQMAGPAGFQDLFVTQHPIEFNKFEVVKGWYGPVATASPAGWLLFVPQAMTAARKGIIPGYTSDWWKFLTAIAIVDQLEKWYSLQVAKERADEMYHTGIQNAWSNIKEGFNKILANMPEFIKKIVVEIGTAIKSILTIMGGALGKIADALADYATKVANAMIAMGKNAINEAMDKTVTTFNQTLAQIETAYNSLVQRFNSQVLEPLQCKVKEIEDKVAKIGTWKLPSIPKLPSIGWPGWGSGGFEPFSRNIVTILTSIDTKLTMLNNRVTVLERK